VVVNAELAFWERVARRARRRIVWRRRARWCLAWALVIAAWVLLLHSSLQ